MIQFFADEKPHRTRFELESRLSTFFCVDSVMPTQKKCLCAAPQPKTRLLRLKGVSKYERRGTLSPPPSTQSVYKKGEK